MISFQELINLSQNWPVQLDWSTAHEHIKGLRLANKPYPVSITEVEANFMYGHILQYGRKNGFELATGLGISTTAIGLAMKETGGQLLTCDNYSEEHLQEVPFGDRGVWDGYPDCYRMFQSLRTHFRLPTSLIMTSSPKIYELVPQGIDFVFLDCPKDDNDLKRDLDGIFPFLAERYSIFLHDSHCFTPSGEQYFTEKFGHRYDKIHKFGPVNQHFPLALFVKD